MHAISADLILNNTLTGIKALGADFTPHVAGGAVSAPTLRTNANGYTSCIFAQSVPLVPQNTTLDIDIPVSRAVVPTQVWLIKTGDQGATDGVNPDSVTVFLGPPALPRQITNATIIAGVLNGTPVAAIQVSPANMEIDPFDPSGVTGYLRLRVVATNLPNTDTRCLVFIECLCSGPM